MPRRTTTAAAGLALAAGLAAAPHALAQDTRDWGERNTGFEPAFEDQFRAPLVESGVILKRRTIASGLEHPWAVAALPDGGGYLVTERSGALRHVTPDGTVSEPIAGVPEVLDERQGGLLDVKLGPDFATDRRVYLTYAKPLGDGLSATAAGFGTLSEDLSRLEGFTDIFVQEPPSPTAMHYGSRIVFDGAGHAFVTTGEHFTQAERELAQDLGATYGKVVRVTLDGEAPQDNPFAGEAGAIASIWSYGHRNVQGAAFHDGQLWTIEHGPAGGDELNLTRAGANYGWPVVSYGEGYRGEAIGTGQARGEGFEEPVYFWDPVIAPGDMAFHPGGEGALAAWQGDVFIGGLVAGGLVRLGLEGGRVTEEERLATDLGRTRDVEILADGSMLVVTDYGDGELVHLMPVPAE